MSLKSNITEYVEGVRIGMELRRLGLQASDLKAAVRVMEKQASDATDDEKSLALGLADACSGELAAQSDCGPFQTAPATVNGGYSAHLVPDDSSSIAGGPVELCGEVGAGGHVPGVE